MCYLVSTSEGFRSDDWVIFCPSTGHWCSWISPAVRRPRSQVSTARTATSEASVPDRGLAAVTLRQGIEAMILDAVPEITEVVDATDHASGTNPYFEAE